MQIYTYIYLEIYIYSYLLICMVWIGSRSMLCCSCLNGSLLSRLVYLISAVRRGVLVAVGFVCFFCFI